MVVAALEIQRHAIMNDAFQLPYAFEYTYK